MILIDVRTEEEYQQAHAQNAMHFDVHKMMNGHMPHVHKNEEILLYSRTGSRSELAQVLMKKAGFTNVTSAGGLMEMVQLGYHIG